jgi:catechol 2,3-dioxygenase-like lactoylglutathione lyase family enzyme
MSEALLSLLVIRTAKLSDCLEFYQKLGLVFVEEKHGSGPVHYSCKAGDVLIELYPATAPDDCGDSNVRLGFSVSSIDEVLQQLRTGGAEILKTPEDTQWGRRVVALDPDGRKVEITER